MKLVRWALALPVTLSLLAASASAGTSPNPDTRSFVLPPAVGAPEIHPSLFAAGVALLAGGTLILSSLAARRKAAGES